MAKIMIEGIKCERCGNEWTPQKSRREKGIKPKVCPKCKSPYFDTPRKNKIINKEEKKE